MQATVFDIGVGESGYEIDWLVRDIFPGLGIADYVVHGFEAGTANYTAACRRVGPLPRVNLHRLAISDHEGNCRLFHGPGPDCHSIYPTKILLVDPSKDYEDVPCSRLSTWIAGNVPEFPADINILRFNVEGAEWPLVEDLDRTGLLGKFQIVCGNCGGDITVVKELMDAGRHQAYLDIIAKWKVDQFWFCWDTVHDETSKQTMRDRLKSLTRSNHD